MTIKEKFIEVGIGGQNVQYFEKLGYQIPKEINKYGKLVMIKGSKIIVKIADLNEGSYMKVTKICDICKNDVCDQEYRVILKQRLQNGGIDKCIGCTNKSKISRDRTIKEEKILSNKFPDLAIEWHPKNKKNSNEVSYGSKKEYWWICKKCSKEYKMSINNRTNIGGGCLDCSDNVRSKGENKIYDYLNKNNYNFKTQFTFYDLVSFKGRKLRFDFAIFDKNENLICLIEYDGEFHYEEKFDDKEEYEKVKNNDILKDEYCKNNNIFLIRIPYWNYGNIEKIISENIIEILLKHFTIKKTNK